MDFTTYIQSIDKDSKVALLHDTDMDGMSAAVLTLRALEKLQKTIALVIPKEHGSREVSQEFLLSLEEHAITHLICVDLALENFDYADKLEKYNVLVLDHHPTQPDAEKSFLVIKPEDIQDRVANYQYCSAHLVYTLFSKLTSLEEYDWLALAGIIGDMTHPHHQPLVQELLEKYNNPLLEDVYETPFARIPIFTGYACSTEHGEEDVFNALLESTTPTEVIDKLSKYTVVEEELGYLREQFPVKRETYKDIHFYKFESEYKLNSMLSTIISKKDISEDAILVTIHQQDEHCSASARRQDGKLHMGEMMDYATEPLSQAQGGGHKPAAGAKFQTKDLETFKERIRNWRDQHE